MKNTEEQKLFRTAVIFLASSGFAMLLLIMRLTFSSSANYIFLAWNLVLAWVPFVAALGLTYMQSHRFRWPGAIALLCLWLLFLPNAPYIITDFLHLRPRAGAPYWFDISLITAFAWNGLLLGFTSIKLVHKFLEERFSKKVSLASILFALLLCGFGVYLGRYERWNSWDIISDPFSLAADIMNMIVHPFRHPRMVGMTLMFFAFMTIGYFTINSIGNLNKNQPA